MREALRHPGLWVPQSLAFDTIKTLTKVDNGIAGAIDAPCASLEIR